MNNANIICKAVITATIENIVRIVPLGGTLVDIHKEISSLQAERKQVRLEEFYVELKNDLEKVQENLNVSYLNKDDFLDIFELTARYIVNERTKDKRILFRNIFINSITVDGCSYDKTEKYLRLVEQMDSLELLILKVLRNPSKFNEEQGGIISDPNWIRPGVRNAVHFTKTYYFVEMLCELLKVSEDDVLGAMYNLEVNRLVISKVSTVSLQTNGHPIDTLANKLSKKGKDFILFILS